MHFLFKDKDSREYGIYQQEPLPIFAAEEDTEYVDVAGREGSLTKRKGGYNDIETSLMCYIKDIGQIGYALAFMQGSGKLVQSVQPDRYINVTVTGVPRAKRLVRDMNAWEMEIPVRIKPFRYVYPEAAQISVVYSGEQVLNPGTHESLPRMKIAGMGDMAITITSDAGVQVIALTGIDSGGLIIDSEKMNCYDLDGITRITNDEKISIEEFPKLYPGINVISWTGNVGSITITPRWRDR